MEKAYRTLIVDDEPLAIERLEKLLSGFPETINLISSAKNGKDAKEKIETLKPDLIFFDIEMPLLTGFELVEQLETIPLIVFCTAHDEYSLKAFETNSIDYLVKPVRLERLEKTINKLKWFNIKNHDQDILSVIKKLSEEKEEKQITSITIKKGDKLIFVKLEDVTYFEAEDKYVNIVTSKGNYMSDKSLTQIENKLPNNFLRVHRAFIINTDYVEEVQKYFNSRYIIKMKNKGVSNIISGRSYLNKIKDWLN